MLKTRASLPPCLGPNHLSELLLTQKPTSRQVLQKVVTGAEQIDVTEPGNEAPKKVTLQGKEIAV